MDYKQAIGWVSSFQKHGMKLGLERIIKICHGLGNPQEKFKTIHVAGTNGKGSVCRFIASILSQNSYNVGIYTSPHLQRFTERIIVNGSEINEEEIIDLVKKIRPIVEKLIKTNDTPTYFEIVTAMAFLYFKKKKVDYAVIEVGLGGRFDATNIIKPILCIITNISLEHENVLGKKISDIAFEKAGIIKKNIPVVTYAEGASLNTIKKVADENKSVLTVVTNDFFEKKSGGINWQNIKVFGSLKEYDLTIQMAGGFQAKNLALSIIAIEILQMNGVYISDESIKKGVKNTIFPGRMEIISSKPLLMLDGAHNIEGIKELIATIKKDFIYNRVIVIFAALKDKNIKEMLSFIITISDILIITKSDNSRACAPEEIFKFLEKQKNNTEIIIKEKIADAIDHAKNIAQENDLILVTGSLFTVGNARDVLGL